MELTDDRHIPGKTPPHEHVVLNSDRGREFPDKGEGTLMTQRSELNRISALAAVLRFSADAFVGLGVFVSILYLSTGELVIGRLLQGGHRLLADAIMSSAPQGPPALLLLAGVFSMLVAFNLAFFRHLLGTYGTTSQRVRFR
jgi:hypothetical protein